MTYLAYAVGDKDADTKIVVSVDRHFIIWHFCVTQTQFAKGDVNGILTEHKWCWRQRDALGYYHRAVQQWHLRQETMPP